MSEGGDEFRVGGDAPGDDVLRGDALRGDALRGDALRGDALGGDALGGDALKPEDWIFHSPAMMALCTVHIQPNVDSTEFDGIVNSKYCSVVDNALLHPPPLHG